MKDVFKKYGIEISDQQSEQFKQLLNLFIEWNSQINLSAIRDEEGIIEKNFVDSLLITQFFDFQNKNILDLGAGGGFPTLPLGVVTDSKIVSLDSVGKKMMVVQDIADKLGLNVHTLHGRAEDFGQNDIYREQFDWVITRAVAPWPVLLELVLPFVKVGGSFIAYQGPQIEEDLATFEGLEEKLGGKLKKIHKTQLGDAERLFVEIEKVAVCPKKYPRKAGEPKRKPLA